MEDDLQDSSSGEDASATDSVSEEEQSWISWFCSIKGNEFFCEVDEDYIHDEFNLTGLSQEVPYFDYALDTILDVDSNNEMLTEEQQETVDAAAELLYGLIHARYILTSKGLNQMFDKFQDVDFGRCSRVFCEGQALLPVGQSDIPRKFTVTLYCPRCNDIYYPKSSKHANIDGAYFGTTFPHLFLMTYAQCIPAPPTSLYIPRVFGFRVHRDAAHALLAGGGAAAAGGGVSTGGGGAGTAAAGGADPTGASGAGVTATGAGTLTAAAARARGIPFIPGVELPTPVGTGSRAGGGLPPSSSLLVPSGMHGVRPVRAAGPAGLPPDAAVAVAAASHIMSSSSAAAGGAGGDASNGRAGGSAGSGLEGGSGGLAGPVSTGAAARQAAPTAGAAGGASADPLDYSGTPVGGASSDALAGHGARRKAGVTATGTGSAAGGPGRDDDEEEEDEEDEEEEEEEEDAAGGARAASHAHHPHPSPSSSANRATRSAGSSGGGGGGSGTVVDSLARDFGRSVAMSASASGDPGAADDEEPERGLYGGSSASVAFGSSAQAASYYVSPAVSMALASGSSSSSSALPSRSALAGLMSTRGFDRGGLTPRGVTATGTGTEEGAITHSAFVRQQRATATGASSSSFSFSTAAEDGALCGDADALPLAGRGGRPARMAPAGNLDSCDT